MRAKSFLLRSCVGLLLCMVLACGESSSPTEQSGVYVPGSEQLFVSEGVVPGRTYNFNKAGTDRGKTTGIVVGDEEIAGSAIGNLTGTFLNRDFQFSVNRNGSILNVRGFWVDNNTIRLTEGASSITLKRQE